MLLTITTTHVPATDLGYLLGKNPARTQSFELAFGRAHVCYPEAGLERCTAALLLDIDPVGLVRRPTGGDSFALGQYTNDRPYVASSFMSVAIGRVFHQALVGRCRERSELATTRIPLEIGLSTLPVRGGERLLRELFEPLGYRIETRREPLDLRFSDWGDSPYHAVDLRITARLQDVLRHLTVLIPVLDDQKHYFVDDEEVEKLLLRGEGWLPEHPARDLIARRYLKHRPSLTREALRRLSDGLDTEPIEREAEQSEHEIEERISLNEERIRTVVETLKRLGTRAVVDLGCGEGKLLRALLRDRAFERIVGMDVSTGALERAHQRLGLDEMPSHQRARIELLQGALTYHDRRLQGFDAATLVEVVEHVDMSRLPALERAVFEHARPGTVLVTTPNAEYNVRFTNLHPGRLRHRDHRFEWTRSEFTNWAESVAQRHGYALEVRGIGPADDALGSPTQMGVFTR